ncbi:glutamate methyltransferase [Xylella taiwanensis]|uniref:Glutamate methyltransferase n=1 Tax=Xylella taiwanensis TaxID=1444770 RepID=Z9JHV3_9GAMM|nr:chemotaxis protein CheB [Xylella taiwanensis]AXI83621.1 glutamate methyltransferase [Xylella taiwanensis]EWS77769.1 glutamate methyltransferase [Xylella taiwanensis]MCD8456705.1 glutamate methyltransferase [Xylella taiwanensis]MCD8459112.1 glutamate methyltransferase [Xylella taiwanensis]MCD8461994.1 glutamate methyltransferase [Xylella taiwanensis]
MSGSNSVQGKLVALLGCAGSARERLREVLIQAGVDLVLEEDPRVLDVRMLLGATPEAVVIALEPVIEEALEALEVVLLQPGLTVIFDEAELIARRQGWEAQRWSRHLVAKLHGQDQDNALPEGVYIEARPEMDLPPNLEYSHVDDPVEISRKVPADDPELVSNLEKLMTALPTIEPVLAPLPAAPLAPLGSWTLGWQLIDEVIVDHPSCGTPGLALSSAPTSSLFGAVLVLAGIGGPDAIRRLLAALPAGFKHPVLIRMDGLDGGQYSNLVRQMGRVSTLPVDLAESGQRVQAGHVYVLRDDLGIRFGDDALVFSISSEDPAALVAMLSAKDSAVLLLSGASAALVPDILAFAKRGAWVAGQASAGCYDPAAASLLELDGQFSGNPTQLAHALSARWPTKH